MEVTVLDEVAEPIPTNSLQIELEGVITPVRLRYIHNPQAASGKLYGIAYENGLSREPVNEDQLYMTARQYPAHVIEVIAVPVAVRRLHGGQPLPAPDPPSAFEALPLSAETFEHVPKAARQEILAALGLTGNSEDADQILLNNESFVVKVDGVPVTGVVQTGEDTLVVENGIVISFDPADAKLLTPADNGVDNEPVPAATEGEQKPPAEPETKDSADAAGDNGVDNEGGDSTDEGEITYSTPDGKPLRHPKKVRAEKEGYNYAVSVLSTADRMPEGSKKKGAVLDAYEKLYLLITE